jgi:hypothetical protein
LNSFVFNAEYAVQESSNHGVSGVDAEMRQIYKEVNQASPVYTNSNQQMVQAGDDVQEDFEMDE